MSESKRDYYEVLGVDRQTDLGEVKRAYRRLAIQYHPDKNPGDAEAEAKFKEATEAYKVISDPEQRKIYDAYGHRGLEGAGFTGFNGADDIFQFSDIFSSVLGDLFGFGGGGGRRGRPRPQKGQNVKTRVTLTFEEAFHGIDREIPVTRVDECVHCQGSGAESGGVATCTDCGGSGQLISSSGFMRVSVPCGSCGGRGRVITRPCDKCRGEGRVRTERTVKAAVPGGVDTGDTMPIAGEGGPGRNGGPHGDLFLVFEVEPHAVFQREGSDLHLDLPISFLQAALGAKVDIELIDGSTAVTIPEGTQPDHVISIRGSGMPDPNSGRRGNLHVHVRVLIPGKLSRKQKKALRGLEELF